MDYKVIVSNLEKEVFQEVKRMFKKTCLENNDKLSKHKIFDLLNDLVNQELKPIKYEIKNSNISIDIEFNRCRNDFDFSSKQELYEIFLEDLMSSSHKDYAKDEKLELLVNFLKINEYERWVNYIRNEIDFFDLVRKSKKYDYFKLNFIDVSMKDSKEYYDLYFIVNKKEWATGNYYNSIKKPVKYETAEFTDREILVLRGAVFRIIQKNFNSKSKTRGIGFTFTDFNKLFSLLGKLEKPINLKGSSIDNSTIDKHGQNMYDGIKNKSEFVETLILKIQDYDISPLTTYLKLYKRS